MNILLNISSCMIPFTAFNLDNHSVSIGILSCATANGLPNHLFFGNIGNLSISPFIVRSNRSFSSLNFEYLTATDPIFTSP